MVGKRFTDELKKTPIVLKETYDLPVNEKNTIGGNSMSETSNNINSLIIRGEFSGR